MHGRSNAKCSWLLNAGVEAQKVGADAANELLHNIDDGGCVDEFLQDQVNTAADNTFCCGVSS